MQYLVMLRRTAIGYSADVPDLPGGVAAGRTLKGAKRRMAEAIALHLELMQQSGENPPIPRQSIEFNIDRDSPEEFCTWVDVELPATVTQPGA